MLPLVYDPFESAVSAEKELGAYEALWSNPKASFGKLAPEFRVGKLPSEILRDDQAANTFLQNAHRISSGASFGLS